MNMITSYHTHPVSQLLTYGDCLKLPRWPEELDYLPLGFGSEHIPDLIRMVLDDDLYWANSDSLEVWAPVHAWRVLGQLQAEAAIEPLLTRLDLVDEEDNDWVSEELPQVFAMIGAAAIAPLYAYLVDPTHDTWACVAAAESLGGDRQGTSGGSNRLCGRLDQGSRRLRGQRPHGQRLRYIELARSESGTDGSTDGTSLRSRCRRLVGRGRLGGSSNPDGLEDRARNPDPCGRLVRRGSAARGSHRRLPCETSKSNRATPCPKTKAKTKAKRKQAKKSRQKNRKR